MAVSKRLRFEILRRDNFRCRYCGHTAAETPTELTVDHVFPVALGGSDEPANLVTACRDCNAGKSASSPDAPLVADVAQDAMRWAAAIKRATDIAMRDRDRLIEIEKAVYEVFQSEKLPSYKGGGSVADFLPSDWFDAIHRFAASGLTSDEMVDAAFIALAARIPRQAIFRYFCGICIRKIDERQAAAHALLETEDD